MVKRMRKSEKLGISMVKDCSVTRFRENLLPLALELLSQLPFPSSFVFSSLFYSFRVQRMEFRAFGAFSDFFIAVCPKLAERRRGAAISSIWAHSGHLGPLQCRGAAYQRCIHPRRCQSARTNFQNGVSPSLFIQIMHMIRRWKALSMIFKLICNMLQKNLEIFI